MIPRPLAAGRLHYINLGVILNLLGTVLIALTFGKYPKKGGSYTTEGNGKKKYYIAHLNHPYLFWAGMILLFLGFVFQLRFE